MLENEAAEIRKDIGLAHGDKIHVDDKDNGENSVLAKLYEQVMTLSTWSIHPVLPANMLIIVVRAFSQINSGSAVVSLSAERRHEVQRGVEAREAELQKILSVTNYLIRRKASRDFTAAPRLAGVAEAAAEQAKRETSVSAPTTPRVVHRTDSARSISLTITDELAQEDVSTLEEQARVLESQNEYLEIPYESIHILSGKENELGCGKAATVYRGLWMHRNGAAEVSASLLGRLSCGKDDTNAAVSAL